MITNQLLYHLTKRAQYYLFVTTSVHKYQVMKLQHDDLGFYIEFKYARYIEHPGWYLMGTTLLGIFAFNLGFLIGSI
jgi:hypothetical protein